MTSPSPSPTAPIVTVVVPGFDVAEYAGEALDSLRAQSLSQWTAVLVDDASSDATGAIFDAAAAADARFEVVHHRERQGLGAARNTGIERVRTPFVAFLDADDLYTPHALDRLVTTLAASGSDDVNASVYAPAMTSCPYAKLTRRSTPNTSPIPTAISA